MRCIRRTRGTTFAEVLVAAAFLGVCAAALTDTVQQSVSNIARSERRAVALAALQDRMEVTTQGAKETSTLPSVILTSVTLPGNALCSVKTTPTWSTDAGVAKIVGTATWIENKGARFYTETITVETYVRCPDVD